MEHKLLPLFLLLSFLLLYVLFSMNCRIAAVRVAGNINIKADTVSRHDEGKGSASVQLLSFYHRGKQPFIE